jgi:hypothetical protein
MKLTKADLIAQNAELIEERNKLCKRIDELTLPQHIELRMLANEKKAYEDKINDLDETLEEYYEQLSGIMGLAKIGYEYSGELTELQINSLFQGILTIIEHPKADDND